MFNECWLCFGGNKKMNENLPESIRYKDYVIRPTPMKVIVEGNEKWNTRCEIWQNKGDENILFPIFGEETYSFKEDAIKHCFNAGQYFIDNKSEQLIK
jgi:hypothetical protein